MKSNKEEEPLSWAETLLYCTNVCYFTDRVLRHEIEITNRETKLKRLIEEIQRITKMLEDDKLIQITPAQRAANFKRFGIAKKSLEY